MRCGAPGCGRFVRAGEARCRRHGGDVGDADEWEDSALAEEGSRRGARRFRDLLAQGEYRALFEPPLGEVLTQAAAERPLVDEIGALRVALARLLAEEEDASKLAAGVARLAGVAIQAAKAQQAIGGEGDDGLNALLERILTETGQEAAGDDEAEEWT